MKVHLLHLLFNLLFDFLCKDFLTRNICTYLPTFYYRIFTFFSKITQLCPQLFFIDWQQMTSFCVTISSRLGSLYAIMTKISTFFYLPFFMTEFLLLCLIQIRDEPIRYIRTRYIFLNNVENLEFYPYSKSFTFLCCTIFTKDSLEIWEIYSKIKKK